jgi:uncharacterized protein (DUF362 family)
MAGEFLGQAQRFLTKESVMNDFSRRRFFQLAGTMGAVASEGFRLRAQQQYPAPVPLAPIYPYTSRSPVSLVKGDVRRKNVLDALMAVDREIRPVMARKKYVLIKINNVSITNQLAATHVDAIRGILDYVAPRFKGPVVIAEASSRDTLEGFANYKYAQVIPEYKKVSLVDLNRENKYEVFAIVDRNIRPTPVRLAARMMDPDAFVISAAMLKTHNAVVATGSVKNMVLGAPLHSLPGETPVWSDKHVYHAMPPNHEQIGVTDGHHAMNYSMAITALHMRRNWGVAVIDGFEGMEGNGPTSGTPVPMHIALASPDYLAVDRVSLETMGIPAHAVGYMQYSAQMGLGQFDLSKIDIRGEKPESVKKTFKLNQNANFQLDWLLDLNKQS